MEQGMEHGMEQGREHETSQGIEGFIELNMDRNTLWNRTEFSLNMDWNIFLFCSFKH